MSGTFRFTGAMKSSRHIPFIVFVLALLLLQVQGIDRHMICKDVQNLFEENQPSRGHQMTQHGRPGKIGPRGPAGMKGERGEPGAVDKEILKAVVAEEVNNQVEERFAHFAAMFEQFNSTLLQMQKEFNKSETAPTGVPQGDIQGSCGRRNGIVYNNKCYWLILHSSTDVKFTAAENLCTEEGGKPADVVDQDHYDLIEGMARPRITSSWLRFWTGMKINPRTKALTTSDGRSQSFAVWYRGFPISSSDAVRIQLLFYKGSSSGEGMFNRPPTFDAHGVLCKQ